MNNIAQCSDISLKQLGVIEDRDIGNQIVIDWVGTFDDWQTRVSKRNRVHTGMSGALPTSGAPLLRVNLEDNNIYRHWSPMSQTFVGGDTLLTALDSGWGIQGTALLAQYLRTGNCCTYVYHLDLQRDGECISMKVVENPWVTRLLHQLQVEIASEVAPDF